MYSDRTTAIVVVWKHLDTIYGSAGPLQLNVNVAFAMLGLEYADDLKNDVGTPLVDVVAKYTADDGDLNTTPERLQSLHDNLLGNLGESALHQRYDGVVAYPAMYDDMADLIDAQASDPAAAALAWPRTIAFFEKHLA